MNTLDALIALVTEIFKLVNTDTSRKYIDKAYELQNQIRIEESKPYDAQDDSIITSLRQELSIISEAARQEIALWRAKQS